MIVWFCDKCKKEYPFSKIPGNNPKCKTCKGRVEPKYKGPKQDSFEDPTLADYRKEAVESM